jgi:integrase
MVLKGLDPVGLKRKAKAQTQATTGTPTFGATATAYLGPQQVFDALDPIWALKPETASRLRGRIAMVLDFARAPDDTRANPAAWSGWLKTKLGSAKKLGKIDRKTGERIQRGHHAALAYKDLPAFWTRLAETPGVAAQALMFVILTASRTSEVLLMTWDEVWFADAVWQIPASRMKMSVAHDVPLTEPALRLLGDQMAQRQKPIRFPRRSPAPAVVVDGLRGVARTAQPPGHCAWLQKQFPRLGR